MATLLGSYGAKSSASRAKFGSSKMLDPNFRREAELFFSLNNQSLTRSWPLDSRGYFEQGIKWHAPLSLDFGLWALDFGGFTL
jgi:hypothetical protein